MAMSRECFLRQWAPSHGPTDQPRRAALDLGAAAGIAGEARGSPANRGKRIATGDRWLPISGRSRPTVLVPASLSSLLRLTSDDPAVGGVVAAFVIPGYILHVLVL
jgi:hypothetical protein